MTDSPAPNTRILLYLAVLATVLIYWAGLKGPFVLDDLPNLSPLQQAIDGQASAREVILGNKSGALGRPISMATLWFSATTGGMHPFPFKIGNLFIHILCGLLGWQLMRRLLSEDPLLQSRASIAAAALAALWLLHPINVSTVLYAVQRMAQLGTLFVLASTLAYVVARQRLAAGDVRSASIWLFVLFPILFIAGIFSKENAAIAPALCSIIELAYFARRPRPGKLLPAFYAVFLLVPAILAAALLLISPDALLNYQERDFTLSERALTQSRALMEYLSLIAFPRGGEMGVFVDDFPLSKGWMDPVSTLASTLALLALSALAIAARRQAPSVFAGWFIFLVAHSIESSIFPLELYFEHRNYLPLFGILLAIAGLLFWILEKARDLMSNGVRIKLVAFGTTALALVLSVITWQQVQVWRSIETITQQALEHHPESARAKLESMTIAADAGRWDDAARMAESLINSASPRHRLLGNLHAITVDCLSGRGGSTSNLRDAEAVGIKTISLAEVMAVSQLARALDEQRCGPGINHAVVADSLVRILAGTRDQSDESRPKWLLRAAASRLYLSANRLPDAEEQAELAWHPTSDPGFGALLVHIYILNGKKSQADRTWHEVMARVKPHEQAAQVEMKRIRAEIDALTDLDQ